MKNPQRAMQTHTACIWLRPLGLVWRAVLFLCLSYMLPVGKHLVDAASASLPQTQETMPACALAGNCDDQDPSASGCWSTDGAVLARRAWTDQKAGDTPMETEVFWSPSCHAWWAETSVPMQHPKSLFIALFLRLCSPDGTCEERRATATGSDLWTRMLVASPGVVWACGAPDAQWRQRADRCTDPMQVVDSQGRPTQGS